MTTPRDAILETLCGCRKGPIVLPDQRDEIKVALMKPTTLAYLDADDMPLTFKTRLFRFSRYEYDGNYRIAIFREVYE